MSDQATASLAATIRVGSSRSLRRRSRWVESAAETAVKAVALTSIAAVILILVFVGKEALPLLTSAAVHRDVTLGALFVPHPQAGFMWQPGDVPKYNIVPLFAGTLKVTCISLIV